MPAVRVSASGDGSVGTDSFTGGVNSAIGSNLADSYDASGFTGFNSFTGLGGDDTITGNGSTQIFFNNVTGGVTVDLATGNVNGDASVGHDTITGGVNGVQGANFDDSSRAALNFLRQRPSLAVMGGVLGRRQDFLDGGAILKAMAIRRNTQTH